MTLPKLTLITLLTVNLLCAGCANQTETRTETRSEAKVIEAVLELTTDEALQGLEGHAVKDKVTVFEFYSPWCQTCGPLDEHLRAVTRQNQDVVVRRIKIDDWEGPIIERYLQEIDALPYVILYNPSRQRSGELVGLRLDALDKMIAMASQPRPQASAR